MNNKIRKLLYVLLFVVITAFTVCSVSACAVPAYNEDGLNAKNFYLKLRDNFGNEWTTDLEDFSLSINYYKCNDYLRFSGDVVFFDKNNNKYIAEYERIFDAVDLSVSGIYAFEQEVSLPDMAPAPDFGNLRCNGKTTFKILVTVI